MALSFSCRLAEQLVERLSLRYILRRLDISAAAELEGLGRKCRIAWDDFCVAVKCLAKPSTAGPNRPVGETRESRKGTLSVSFISVRFNHRWCSSTTKLAMDLPWVAFAFQPMVLYQNHKCLFSK